MKARLLATAVLLAAVGIAADLPPIEGCGSAASQVDSVVPSFDGTRIAVTVFRPADVCADAPTPVILTLHGWAGSRSTSAEAADVGPFLAAGYGVVAIDARGHGGSEGLSLVHHPDREVRDFQAVLDWIHDELDWVERDAGPVPKDVVAGAYGASYGGGFQLMTAAYDERLDALVPMATWSSLPAALAPNRGAVRSDWLTLLYAAGETRARLDPKLGEWYRDTMRENHVPHDALHSFGRSSPLHRLSSIDVPTLLIQGLPDTLFNLNQAVVNYEGIRATGADVRLVGVNSGHQLPAVQPTALGHDPDRAASPCIDLGEHTRDFLDAHLRDDETARARLATVPRVQLATEQGGCVVADGWPVARTTRKVALTAIAAPNPAGSVLIPLMTAEEPLTLAGIPTLVGTPLAELDDILYLSLVVRDRDGLHVVDDQVIGVRLRTGCASVTTAAAACGRAGPVVVELGGVATELEPGQELLLRVDGANEQHALNGNRRPGVALLTAVEVSLPFA